MRNGLFCCFLSEICLQIKKSEEELNKGFLEKTSYAIPKPRKLGDEVKTVTMMLFGNAKECEIATRMIDEAIENREQKQKQREKEYEKKREQKNRDRQMYHLRHTHDYEALGIPIGRLLLLTSLTINGVTCAVHSASCALFESYHKLKGFPTYED